MKNFKFAEYNNDRINELDKFIDNNKGKVRALLMDDNMLSYIKTLDKFEEFGENKIPKYNSVRIIIDCYQPYTFISFLMKEAKFVLSVPCGCPLTLI